ncbi:MAG: signal peptide peptidase SppA [Dysgonamonadaceae bacterium]|jgi:protease-4|nr:signal peptide peptidase SppA [Dysgonamonadaceae bacterium]
MKDFFKMMFASIFGVFIASVIVGIISIITLIGILASSGSQTFVPKKNTVLKIDLSGVMSDRVVDNPFAALFGGKNTQQLSLVDVIASIEKAKENKNIKGIYLKGDLLVAGTSSVEAIRKALIDFKESEKFVVAYGGNCSQSAYYLLSVADKVILNPQGMVDLHGLAATPTYYVGLLEKLGIKMEIFKVGTFKSAVEPFMLDKMSDANREQVKSYTGSMWNNITLNIAESRNLKQEDLNTLVNEGLLLKGSDYLLSVGLVDTLLHSTDAANYIKGLVGIDLKDDLNIATISDMKSLSEKKNNAKDEIAVLFAEGEITEASSGLFSSSSVISEEEYVKELRKLRENENVKAVVFRVNSPGGSAYISEQIWKEVVETKKVKPIIVSMGDYAASGGYYISCGADWIVAEPTTLTGSIGIFGIIPIFEGLMGKIGVTTDVEKTNKFADFGDVSRPMNIDEKRLMQSFVEKGYDTFITRCADGRGKTKEEIDAIGQGRVWTGAQALTIGLVDELGGLNRAIEIAAERANLEKFVTNHYPEQKDFLTLLLEDSFGGVKVNLLKSMLNETEYRHYSLIKNLEKQDNIQARMPFDVDVR